MEINVRHSSGGVEGKVNGKKSPKAVQGFLEEKQGQFLGKRWPGVTASSSLLPPECG